MYRCYAAKLADYDVNNLSKDIVFCVCMDPTDFNSNSYSEKVLFYDEERLRELLYSNKLQRYEELLLDYVKELYFRIEKLAATERHSIVNQETQSYTNEIITMLFVMMNARINSTYGIDISIKDINDRSVKINNHDLSERLEKILAEEYIRLEMNVTDMTFEEAKESINNYEDIDWFTGQGLYTEYFDGITLYPSLVPEDVIFEYAQLHWMEREISFDLVSERYKLLMNSVDKTKKRGARQVNTLIAEFAVKISYLYRFNEFINQNEISIISEYPISNAACLFTYNFLLLFEGFIRQEVVYNDDDREKRTNYIKAIIKHEYKKNKESEYTDIEDQINKIRRVKQGVEVFNNEDVVQIKDIEKLIARLDELQAKFDRGELT